MPGLAFADGFQCVEAAAGDDDVVAQSVECLGEAPADSGTTSGDQNGVTRQLHALFLSVAFCYLHTRGSGPGMRLPRRSLRKRVGILN